MQGEANLKGDSGYRESGVAVVELAAVRPQTENRDDISGFDDERPFRVDWGSLGVHIVSPGT